MRTTTQDSGQALIESSLAVVMLCVFVFGIIDACRAIYDAEVITNLAGEGSSMASRGVRPFDAAKAVVTYAGTNINLNTMGCVIVTAVTNTGASANPLQVTAQASQCGIAVSSKVGCLKGAPGCGSSNATLPEEAALALQVNQSLYVTEIFYTYVGITPLSNLLGSSILPPQLYRAAYY